MKNKKKILIISLLALVLVLGVGYAAVTGVKLEIDGGSEVEDTQLRVRFEKTDGANVDPSAITVDNSYNYSTTQNGGYNQIDATCTAKYLADTSLNTYTNNSVVQPMAAEMTVEKMSWVGQTATATFTILNYEKDLDAVISCSNDDVEITKADGITKANGEDANEYFKVTVDTDNNDKTIAAKGTNTNPNSTTVKVTVELTKLPIETENSSVTFRIPISAEPAQPANP